MILHQIRFREHGEGGFVPQQERQEQRMDDAVAKQAKAEQQLADAFGELLPGEQAVISNMSKESLEKISKYIAANSEKFNTTDAVKDYLSAGANALLRMEASREKQAKRPVVEQQPAQELRLRDVSSLESAKQVLEDYYGDTQAGSEAIEEFNFAIAPLMGGGIRATPEKFQEIVGAIVRKQDAKKLRKQQSGGAATGASAAM